MWGDGGGYNTVGRIFHQIGLTAMDGVCFRASSTYPGRRSPSALDGHPPRDHAHPNKHQAWASCDGRRRPLRFNGHYTWNSYASWSATRAQLGTQAALAIHNYPPEKENSKNPGGNPVKHHEPS